MTVGVVENNNKNSQYGGYAGAAVGALGSTYGVYKTSKVFSPMQKVLKNTKGVIESASDTFVKGQKAVSGVLANVDYDVFFDAIEKATPNFEKALDQVLEGKKFDSLSDAMGAIANSIKTQAAQLADTMPETLDGIADIAPRLKALFEIAGEEVDIDSLKAFLGSTLNETKEGLAKNSDLIDETLAPLIEALKKDCLDKEAQQKFIEALGIDETARTQIKECGESLSSTKKQLGALGESLKPYIDKIQNSFKEITTNPKGAKAGVTNAIDSALKTLGKYKAAAIFASIALIPAGFGIGKLVDMIVDKTKSTKSEKTNV